VTYLAVFLAALAWSGHCVGMCGGFALSLAGTPTNLTGKLARQLLYHAGKTFTYLFLGVLAFAVGLSLRQFALWLSGLAGGLLILIGLHLLGVFRRAVHLNQWLTATPVCSLLTSFLRDPTPGGAFLLGLGNGFLPCPLVYAMLAYVATLPAVLPAALTMTLFGLGTAPALVALGLAGGALRQRWPLLKISGGITLALGVVTLLRGFDFFHAFLPGHCCH
jgi:hypothetical protein